MFNDIDTPCICKKHHPVFYNILKCLQILRRFYVKRERILNFRPVVSKTLITKTNLINSWGIRETPIRKIPTGKIPTHQTPPWKIPTRNIPTQKIPTWNITTHAFKYFHPSFYIFCFFHICQNLSFESRLPKVPLLSKLSKQCFVFCHFWLLSQNNQSIWIENSKMTGLKGCKKYQEK